MRAERRQDWYLRRSVKRYSAETGSRRRRGYDVDIPWRLVDETEEFGAAAGRERPVFALDC